MSHNLPSEFEKQASKKFFKGDPDCDMCEGRGIVSEGDVDDQHDVPCPCTISEPEDMSGATEGDR